MEQTAPDLEESEMKQSKLKLTLMWKDLLEHIDFTKKDQETQFGILENQLEAKANELDGIDKLIQEKVKEVESNKQHLCSLQLLIQEHEEELSLKEKQFSDVQRFVGNKERECELIEIRYQERTKRFQKCEEELSLLENRFSDFERSVGEMERQYDVMGKRIQNRENRLNWLEKTVEEKLKLVEFRKKELKVIRAQLDKCSQKIELKERQFNEILGSVEEQQEEFSFKEKQNKGAQRSIDNCDKEIKLKEEKLSLIQKLIVDCSNTLKSREKSIRAMDLKMKDFCLHKKTMEEWSRKLELREKQFESKVDDLNNRINECLNEVQLKEKHFDSFENLIEESKKHLDSQEKSLQEYSNGLEMKERQHAEWAKEIELKQQQIDSIRASTEDHTQNLEYTPASIIAVPSSSSNQSSMKRGGRGLQLLMNEHLKRIALLASEMSVHLKASSNPAELVLDAMEGFYPSNLDADKMKFDFDLTVIRRSCVLLLQELKRLSPQINHQVREEAIKLAADWKAKMTVAAENSLEISGFLWLLTAYELTSTYNARELQSLLAIVAQTEHATELCQTLDITEKAPDFIQNLIERKQLIEAIRFICTFNLIDKFPPAPLLKEYMEDAWQSFWTIWLAKESLDEKNKVVDKQIADLRAVIQCIKDYNLESEYASKDIEIQIVELEKLRGTWRHSGRPYVFEQELEKRKESSSSTSDPRFQPPEKRQAIAAARPCALPTFTRGYPQLSSSSQLRCGHSVQFDMAANDHEAAGANFGAMQLSLSSRLHSGHPEQFGMAANIREIGANFGWMPLRMSPQLLENDAHPARFRVAASDHEIGTNFSAMQNAGLLHPHHLLPSPHSYHPN
ncbi:cytadherence high molecular weight protein 2-like isoform X4 [Prunus dulcis]|uniref:cytadherence high molecular weight protein 2-like isoform X4 n=1 Tax=Prunus dulcis TaxID=3755 RepID=UPI00148348AB|nr:cytadherence high molecular weight protein 2-like isoform X4 [Prunus dulcis]